MTLRDMTVEQLVNEYITKRYNDSLSPEQYEQVLKSIEFAIGYNLDDLIEDAIMGVLYLNQI